MEIILDGSMKILLVDKGRGGAQGGGPPLYMKKKSMSKIEF